MSPVRNRNRSHNPNRTHHQNYMLTVELYVFDTALCHMSVHLLHGLRGMGGQQIRGFPGTPAKRSEYPGYRRYHSLRKPLRGHALGVCVYCPASGAGF